MTQNAFTAKSECFLIFLRGIFLKFLGFIFNAAVNKASEWIVIAGKDMPLVKIDYDNYKVLKKSTNSKKKFKNF